MSLTMSQSIMDEVLPYWLAAKGKFHWVADSAPKTNIAMVVGLLFIAVYKHLTARKGLKEHTRKQKGNSMLPPIEPLENFDWRSTEPMQLRPYKPLYHLTMALETMDPSELIPMDNTYKDRIAHRRTLLKEKRDFVLGARDEKADPRIRAAVGELYQFVMSMYLPTRYPRMFKLFETSFDDTTGKANMLQNLVTGEILPTILTPNQSAITALETLAKTVDEDMLVLLPKKKKGENNKNTPLKTKHDGLRNRKISSTQQAEENEEEEEDGTKYVLEAYQTCFPSGFDLRTKLGKQLSAIHDPVPGYKEKIEKSMDRFFDKLEVGKFVKRANWSITTGGDDLFSPFGLHGADGEKLEAMELEDLDPDNMHFRCERQTLYRLPGSGALVFSIHTYRYTLRQIKEEGSGEDLAAAIDGIPNGSVPRMAMYKRMPVWGDAVKAYLRG